MRGVAQWLVVTMVAAVLAGCAAQAGGPPQSEFGGLQSKDALAKVGWQYYWNVLPPPGLLQSGETLDRILMVGDALVCVTDQNRLIAYEASTGRFRWYYNVRSPDRKVYDPIFVKDVSIHEAVPGLAAIIDPEKAPMAKPFDAVVVHTAHYVIVLNAMTGKVVRDDSVGRFQDVSPGAGGCADSKRFYGVTPKGLCFAYDLDSGIRTWTFGGYSGVSAPLREFAGQVFLANQDGEIMAAQAGKSLKMNWMQSISEPIVAPLAVSKRGLFVAGEQGNLQGFESIGGARTWKEPFRCQGRLVDAPQVSGRTVFQYAQGDTFYAVNLSDGKKRWTMKNGRTVLAIVGEEACILDARRVLRVVNEETGKEKYALPMTGLDLFLPTTASDGIWAAARDGRVFCLRPLSAGRLTLDKLNAP
ncbi:MAG: PQQ-binding-like beta-propeller repeat protein [Planctomycetota bacterium]|nr:PQQ-binding-like beta-propeller repeat protein [Planctomycetota bacterium]